jgi:hypothetical protein
MLLFHLKVTQKQSNMMEELCGDDIDSLVNLFLFSVMSNRCEACQIKQGLSKARYLRCCEKIHVVDKCC